MSGFFAARRARRAYEAAQLQRLIFDNKRELARLRELRQCPVCAAMEPPRQRKACIDR